MHTRRAVISHFNWWIADPTVFVQCNSLKVKTFYRFCGHFVNLNKRLYFLICNGELKDEIGNKIADL